MCVCEMLSVNLHVEFKSDIFHLESNKTVFFIARIIRKAETVCFFRVKIQLEEPEKKQISVVSEWVCE